MAKKRKKKRKLKISRVFLAIIIFIILGYLMDLLCQVPIRGYYIVNNTYYTDQEILKLTKLDKYPSYILTNSYMVNKEIKNNELIDSIKLKKHINGMYEIIVNENKILFYDNTLKKSILTNKKEISYYYETAPVLVNEIDNKKIKDKLISKMIKLDKNILNNVSEIKYDPNEIDKERFLFSMNDGNYVYLTLSKFSNINRYLEISNTLSDKNGILYLDYGNYFVPKE